MLYDFLLIFNLFIDSCYSRSTHATSIVQCINWLTDFTKIVAYSTIVTINITSHVCSVNA